MKKLLNTLYITSPDRWLSLDGENVVISEKGSDVGRVPLHNLESIAVFGSVGATPALMGKCAEDGIGLYFLSRSGRFLCSVCGEIGGNVLLRREQYRIADDEERSLDVAKAMIAGKVFNSRYSVERTLRDHALRIDTAKFEEKSEFLINSARNCRTAASKDALRGMEGEAASVYFSAFDDMILQQKDDFRFKSRSKRPPLDNVNALLSFAYTLMVGMCTSALCTVGLDPFVGFMHTDRPGRRSLALDLMEEFRAVVCDRFVLNLINKKQISANDLEQRENGAVLLGDNGRKTFISAWQSYKQEEITHPFLKEKVQRGMLPFVQALLLSRFIRGDLDCYPVFLWK
ncbi:MAG: type I-C CRISPR-associated endonuclease Cas1c [Bacteroides sp.]|nr:type I-C CRISPR-associated endonuclease Cas1c [Eubacterium sp.]MCM1418936.1 type I-C CRISPR-associated endonuclease Cas1c [Roseburia sp.]MCM1462120.1 type I-C CRISPR-associated endonuclease Cas1c [Bacteroides sp.]